MVPNAPNSEASSARQRVLKWLHQGGSSSRHVVMSVAAPTTPAPSPATAEGPHNLTTKLAKLWKRWKGALSRPRAGAPRLGGAALSKAALQQHEQHLCTASSSGSSNVAAPFSSSLPHMAAASQHPGPCTSRVAQAFASSLYQAGSVGAGGCALASMQIEPASGSAGVHASHAPSAGMLTSARGQQAGSHSPGSSSSGRPAEACSPQLRSPQLQRLLQEPSPQQQQQMRQLQPASHGTWTLAAYPVVAAALSQAQPSDELTDWMLRAALLEDELQGRALEVAQELHPDPPEHGSAARRSAAAARAAALGSALATLQGLQAVISSGKAAALAPSSRVSVVQLIMADVVERLPREGLEQLPAVSGLAAMTEVGRQLCAGARSLSVQPASHPTAQHEPPPLSGESDSDDASDSDVLGSISTVLTCGEGCTYQPRRSLAYEARLAGSQVPSALTLHPSGPPAARTTAAAPAVATLASICSSGSWAVDAASSSGAPAAPTWDVSSMQPLQRQRVRPHGAGGLPGRPSSVFAALAAPLPAWPESPPAAAGNVGSFAASPATFAYANDWHAPAAALPSPPPPPPPPASIVDLNSLTVGELLQALCAALARGG